MLRTDEIRDVKIGGLYRIIWLLNHHTTYALKHLEIPHPTEVNRNELLCPATGGAWAVKPYPIDPINSANVPP